MTLSQATNPLLNDALGKSSPPGTTFNRVENYLSMLVGIITVVGSVYFVFQIFTGAFQWITAGSDKDSVQKAQKKFTNSTIGLIVLLFAYTLIAFVANLLGYNIFAISSSLSNLMSVVK